MKRKRTVPLAVSTLAVALCILLGATQAAYPDVNVQMPPDVDGIDTDGDGDPNNDHVYLHLTGGDGYIKMADGRDMYIFGFADATGINDNSVVMHRMVAAQFPSPLIVLDEGQKLYLTMTNVGMMMRPDLFDPHTIHWHGFPEAAPVFDGVPDASIAINMMASVTYYYNVVHPGTYIYHCHVEATEHMQMGMLGQLYVRPKQNKLPDGTDLDGFTHHTGYTYAYNDGDGSTYHDVSVALQFNGMDPAFHDASENVQPLPFAAMVDTYHTLNGRGYPDTVIPGHILNKNDWPAQQDSGLIVAETGQKILLRLTSLSTTDYYTVTTQGIPMTVIGQGARMRRGPDGKDLTYTTTSVTLGGGETRDVLLDTTGLPAGTYFLYTTNLDKLANHMEDYGGIMTEIVLTPPAAPAAAAEPQMSLAGSPAVKPANVTSADGIAVAPVALTAEDTALTFSYDGQDLASFILQIATTPDFEGRRILTIPKTHGRRVELNEMHLRVVQRWSDIGPLYWRVLGIAPDGRRIAVSDAQPLTVDSLPELPETPTRHR